MHEVFERFAENPLLRPADVRPSAEGLRVECLLNPGAFRYAGKTWLLLRVAERPEQRPGRVSTPILDPDSPGGMRILEVSRDDPGLTASGDRGFVYRGTTYLTTLSHLRLASSQDGVRFQVEESPALVGSGELEAFGVEDCRVVEIAGTYYLTYSAVSFRGVGVGLASTRDWRRFARHGMILPPHNKDCAIFPEKVGGSYWCLHRPSGVGLGGNYIWVARSQDLVHWGDHRFLAATRPGKWDSERVGAGAAPIRTDRGWLEIYHGADHQGRYCLGALLLDLRDPSRVVARSEEPLFEPVAEYEKKGFVGSVVFTNGQVVDGDELTIYYGAADTVVCAARASVRAILETLR